MDREGLSTPMENFDGNPESQSSGVENIEHAADDIIRVTFETPELAAKAVRRFWSEAYPETTLNENLLLNPAAVITHRGERTSIDGSTVIFHTNVFRTPRRFNEETVAWLMVNGMY